MILFVIIYGRLFIPSAQNHRSTDETVSAHETRTMAELPVSIQRWSRGEPKPRGNRNLETYYERRQYPGGPPKVPHPVTEQFQDDGTKQCKNCHVEGGYVPKYRSYAPKTPHPELSACQQCHVPSRTNDLFRENNWKSVRPPRLGQSALPGSPPQIPHTLLMRRNCTDCHAGPTAPKSIKTDHPERAHCTQCHVPKTTRGAWSRSDDG